MSDRDPVSLSDVTPVARGSERAIYPHPWRDDLLLKLRLPGAGKTTRGSLRYWAERAMPQTTLRASIAEQREQARQLLIARDTARPPFARMFGYIPTDLGWALQIERIGDDAGTVGFSLGTVCKSRELDTEELDALNIFARQIRDRDVRASDLNPNNMVIDSRDGLAVILVDGLGDTHAIPIRTWSRRLNRLANSDEFRRYSERLRLTWDRDNWRFVRPQP